MLRSSTSTTVTVGSSSAAAVTSSRVVTPPAPNRPPMIVTTINDVTPRIQVFNTKAPRNPQCHAFIPKNKNLKSNTETLLQAMQRAAPFVRRGQKVAAWLVIANLCRDEPDLVHVTGALCETRYKEARKEYEDRQKKVIYKSGSSNFDQDLLMEDITAREDEFIIKDRERLEAEANLAVEIGTFQAADIDIHDQATEEAPHAARGGRTISEEPQDQVDFSGAESNGVENVQIIQRRHRKRRKVHQ
ncbi:MAG: hypothetical protein J3R72DRAFT_499595 [Linnemannia gamsii]|nr:MAG: hypothetical protein J3R72DRAFT_499595 [Linnemannia gamsii]